MTATATGGLPLPADLDAFAAEVGWTGEVPILADPAGATIGHFYPDQSHNGVMILIAPDMTIAVKRTTFEQEITAVDVEAVL